MCGCPHKSAVCVFLCVPADLYVKLYVVNVATQKRIIKKKTRVCRHDREPSFNETFRFCMNPTGHSLQVAPYYRGVSHHKAEKKLSKRPLNLFKGHFCHLLPQ